MVAPGPTSAWRCGPKLQLAWRCVNARPAPCLELELVCGCTRSSGCRHNYKGKALKPSPMSLLKNIKGVMKVTNHTLRDRIPRWWMHINILTQLTIKKSILYIKLRDGPLLNRSHNKKSVNSDHMSNKSKSLIIIMTLLMLKTTSNKTSLIALKRTVRESLNLIDPLTSD
jgi:hypothetical protein